jgi:hypothetical protein
MRVVLLLAFGCVLAGCPPSGEGDAECSAPADCATPDAAPCDGCPSLAVELCLDGECAARGEDAVDVTVATLLIDRDADGVNGLRFAVVADAPCDDVIALGDDVNALAAGQKTLTGGDLHQDVALGRVPEGSVTIVVLGTSEASGQGSVLARGCASGLLAEAPSLVVEQIDLAR